MDKFLEVTPEAHEELDRMFKNGYEDEVEQTDKGLRIYIKGSG